MDHASLYSLEIHGRKVKDIAFERKVMHFLRHDFASIFQSQIDAPLVGGSKLARLVIEMVAFQLENIMVINDVTKLAGQVEKSQATGGEWRHPDVVDVRNWARRQSRLPRENVQDSKIVIGVNCGITRMYGDEGEVSFDENR